MKLIRTVACALLCLTSLPSFALSEQGQTPLQTLQARWAEINYQLPKEQREKAFALLSEDAQKAVAAEPDAAELQIWNGIILSTYAGAKGGLGALGLVKEAKASLEQGLTLDPKALSGSAYTSLGSLYYQVPGWPVGFGDDEKAEHDIAKTWMLRQAAPSVANDGWRVLRRIVGKVLRWVPFLYRIAQRVALQADKKHLNKKLVGRY